MIILPPPWRLGGKRCLCQPCPGEGLGNAGGSWGPTTQSRATHPSQLKQGGAGINYKGYWQHRACGLCSFTRGAVLCAMYGQDLPQENDSHITIYASILPQKEQKCCAIAFLLCTARQHTQRATSVARAELNISSEGSLFSLDRSVTAGSFFELHSPGTKITGVIKGRGNRASVHLLQCAAVSEGAVRFQGWAGC